MSKRAYVIVVIAAALVIALALAMHGEGGFLARLAPAIHGH